MSEAEKPEIARIKRDWPPGRNVDIDFLLLRVAALEAEKSKARAETRKTVLDEALAKLAGIQPSGTMNFRRGSEEGIREGLRILESMKGK